MKRDLFRLSTQIFDVLVVGSGIYGACVAWDAALRGLSVALIDQGDFGSATSANSLKTIHGGLRYLQDANLLLMQSMSGERGTWLKVAPHLVHPLPCLVPTYQKLTRSKAAFTVGLRINDLMSYDQNHYGDPEKHLPRGEILTREECLRRLPGIREDGITGGALWYDAQVYNTERLLLSFVLSASEAGASVANYVEATGFLMERQRIIGIQVKDRLSGQAFEIRARMVVNCTGAWVDSLLAPLDKHSKPRFRLSTAINLVTRQILPNCAVGFQSKYVDEDHSGKERSRLLFMSPWRSSSIIGTIHRSYSGHPGDFRLSENMIREFIEEINRAFPGAALTREDVYYTHSGFLPLSENSGVHGRIKLLRESRVHDHELENRIPGLITVIGVKYTTARKTAQIAVDLVVKKLGRKDLPSRTRDMPVYGGQIENFTQFLNQAKHESSSLEDEVIDHLVHTYGTYYSAVLEHAHYNISLGQRISSASPVLLAEFVHAIRYEMAQKISDIVFRRTELATTGRLDDAGIQACAEVMACELGWDQFTKNQAIEEARIDFERYRAQSPERIGAI